MRLGIDLEDWPSGELRNVDIAVRIRHHAYGTTPRTDNLRLDTKDRHLCRQHETAGEDKRHQQDRTSQPSRFPTAQMGDQGRAF